MTDISPYNTNPELVAMKEDIATRRRNFDFKHGVMQLGVLVGAIVAGVLGAAIFGPMLPAVVMGYPGTLLAGGALGIGAFSVLNAASEWMLTKERIKLQYDEQYIDNTIPNKGYWGEGYRKEVAEHGYSFGGAVVPGLPPHVGKDVANQR